MDVDGAEEARVEYEEVDMEGEGNDGDEDGDLMMDDGEYVEEEEMETEAVAPVPAEDIPAPVAPEVNILTPIVALQGAEATGDTLAPAESNEASTDLNQGGTTAAPLKGDTIEGNEGATNGVDEPTDEVSHDIDESSAPFDQTGDIPEATEQGGESHEMVASSSKLSIPLERLNSPHPKSPLAKANSVLANDARSNGDHPDQAEEGDEVEYDEEEYEGSEYVEEDGAYPYPTNYQSLPPVVLQLPDLEARCLFQTIQNDEKLQLPVWLKDKAEEMVEANLGDVLASIREEMEKENLVKGGELIMTEKQMGLKMGEDDINLQSITLLEFVQLHHGCGLQPPVQLHLTFEASRFFERFSAIQKEVKAQLEQTKASENGDEEEAAEEDLDEGVQPTVGTSELGKDRSGRGDIGVSNGTESQSEQPRREDMLAQRQPDDRRRQLRAEYGGSDEGRVRDRRGDGAHPHADWANKQLTQPLHIQGQRIIRARSPKIAEAAEGERTVGAQSLQAAEAETTIPEVQGEGEGKDAHHDVDEYKGGKAKPEMSEYDAEPGEDEEEYEADDMYEEEEQYDGPVDDVEDHELHHRDNELGATPAANTVNLELKDQISYSGVDDSVLPPTISSGKEVPYHIDSLKRGRYDPVPLDSMALHAQDSGKDPITLEPRNDLPSAGVPTPALSESIPPPRSPLMTEDGNPISTSPVAPIPQIVPSWALDNTENGSTDLVSEINNNRVDVTSKDTSDYVDVANDPPEVVDAVEGVLEAAQGSPEAQSNKTPAGEEVTEGVEGAAEGDEGVADLDSIAAAGDDNVINEGATVEDTFIDEGVADLDGVDTGQSSGMVDNSKVEADREEEGVDELDLGDDEENTNQSAEEDYGEEDEDEEGYDNGIDGIVNSVFDESAQDISPVETEVTASTDPADSGPISAEYSPHPSTTPTAADDEADSLPVSPDGMEEFKRTSKEDLSPSLQEKMRSPVLSAYKRSYENDDDTSSSNKRPR